MDNINFIIFLFYKKKKNRIITGHEITSIPKDVGELKHLKYM